MVKIKEDITGWVMKEHGVLDSKLTVIGRSQDYISPGGRRYARWRCICECGKEVIDKAHNIKNGIRLSCGCTKERNKGTRLYSIWQGMKSRCYNKNTIHYDKYGGRGIFVCDEWRNSFLSFKQWAINNGYKPNLTIDRIDVNKNYEPSNCRWSTMEEQSNNRRNNYMIEYNGEIHTLSEWSKKTGIKAITLWDRINLLKWSIDKALTTKNANEKLLEYNNEVHNIKQWATILNINYGTLRSRLKKGESLKDIIKNITIEKECNRV